MTSSNGRTRRIRTGIRCFFLDVVTPDLVHISILEDKAVKELRPVGIGVWCIPFWDSMKEAVQPTVYHYSAETTAGVVCSGDSATCLVVQGRLLYQGKEGGILKPRNVLGRHRLVV